MSTISKPYKALLVDRKSAYGCRFEVAKIGRGGNPNRSGRVLGWSRCYADTWEEAAVGYNKLVDDQISFLRSLIEDCESDKI